MNRTAVALSIITGVAGAAHAIPPGPTSMSLLDANAMDVDVVTDFDFHAAAVVLERSGDFNYYTYDGTAFHYRSTISGSPAIHGRGLSVVRVSQAIYVFENEDSGLYVTKQHANGVWDPHWCHVTSAALAGAPAAVSLGEGNGFQIATRTAGDGLLVFHVDNTDTTSACGAVTQLSAASPSLSGTPSIVSWGANRYDIFGRTGSGYLGHWWGTSATGSPLFESDFRTAGTSKFATYNLSNTIGNVDAVVGGTLYPLSGDPHSIVVALRRANNEIATLSYLESAGGWTYGAFATVGGSSLGLSLQWSTDNNKFLALPSVCTELGSDACWDYHIYYQAWSRGYASASAPHTVRGITDVYDYTWRTYRHVLLMVGAGGLYWVDDTYGT